MQATANWTNAIPQECSICSGMHDQEIHEATVSIHRWLRHEIETWFEPQQFSPNATVEAVSATIPVAQGLPS